MDSDGDAVIPSKDSNNNGGDHIAKAATKDENNKSYSEKGLPDTGEQATINTTLIGGLIAGIGSLFLFGRRRKEDK